VQPVLIIVSVTCKTQAHFVPMWYSWRPYPVFFGNVEDAGLFADDIVAGGTSGDTRTWFVLRT